jgi:hypothetical protein
VDLGAGLARATRRVLGLAQAYADVLEAGFHADLGRPVSNVEARLGARPAATELAFGHFAMLTQWAAEGAPADLQKRSDRLVRNIRRQLPTAGLR